MRVVRTIGQAFEISHKLSTITNGQTKEASPVLKQKELSKESTNKSQEKETKASSSTNLNSSNNSSKSLVKSKQLASTDSVNKLPATDKNETSKERLSRDPSNDRLNDCKTSIESLKLTGDSQSNLIDNLVDTSVPNEASQKKKSSSSGNFAAMTRSSQIRKSNVSEYSLGRQSQTSSAAKDILDVLRTIEDRLKQLTNKVDTIEENQKKMLKRMWEKDIKESESFFQKESPISRNSAVVTSSNTTNPFGKNYGKSFDTLSLSLNSAPHNNRHSTRNKSSRSSFRCLTRPERKTGLIDTSLSLDSPEKLSLSPFSSGISFVFLCDLMCSAFLMRSSH